MGVPTYNYLFSFTIRPKSTTEFEQKVFGNEFTESLLITGNFRPTVQQATEAARKHFIPSKYSRNHVIVPLSGVDFIQHKDVKWWKSEYPENWMEMRTPEKREAD